MFDNWIDKLSIEYAVPMVYQGRKENQDIRRVKKFFTDNKNWRSKKCQNYIGLMAGDVLTVPTALKSLYLIKINGIKKHIIKL